MIQIQPRDNPSPFLPIAVASGRYHVVDMCNLAMVGRGKPVMAFYAMFDGVFGPFLLFQKCLPVPPRLFSRGLRLLWRSVPTWNIGAEGQLYLGALAAVLFGTGWLDLPSFLLIPLLVQVGAIAGVIGMVVPTYLKTRFGADEVVTTLLLNFIRLFLYK